MFHYISKTNEKIAIREQFKSLINIILA